MGALADLIDRRAAQQAGTAYLRDARDGRAVTYADLAAAARRWAAHLDAEDVPPGGRVLLSLTEPVELAVAHLSVIAAGRISVPVDPDAPAADLDRTIAATTPSLIVRSVPELPEPAGPGQDRPADRPAGGVQLHTSGSTGEPKVVHLTEDQLLHVARCVADHNQLEPTDVGYSPLPLFHINAQVVAVLATLVAGARLVVDRRFSRSGFPRMLDEFGVSWVNGVPAILTILAADPVPPGAHRLRFVRSASAPLPVAIKQQIQSRWGTVVVESYGMTEAASQITATPLSGGAPEGSAGRPVGTEVRIKDGHLQIRGRGVITGYVGGRAADRFDEDGWLDTGDLGRIDQDGFVFVLGRADDVINRGGELIYPREVEEVLLRDERVREAVVVGRPDPILGQVPVALVVAESCDFGQLLDALRERCAGELSRFKRPADIRVVASLPKGSTGKIRRRAVLADEHAATPQNEGTPA
jgi:acyl-CoA synthetase (AMP-forming)/AMP-acid ligase II